MIIRKYFLIFSLFLMTSGICWSTKTNEAPSLGEFRRGEHELNREKLDNFLFELYKFQWQTFTAAELCNEFIYVTAGHDSDLYSVVQNRLPRTLSYLFYLFGQKGVVKVALSEKSAEGDTPLLQAVKMGSVELVQIMLEMAETVLSKEDLLDVVSITDENNKNVLECAAESDDIAMIQIINQAIDSLEQDENVCLDNVAKATKTGRKSRPNKKNRAKKNARIKKGLQG